MQYFCDDVINNTGRLLGVILPLLDVESPQHFDFVQVVINLPVNEVNFLQQLLLMIF